MSSSPAPSPGTIDFTNISISPWTSSGSSSSSPPLDSSSSSSSRSLNSLGSCISFATSDIKAHARIVASAASSTIAPSVRILFTSDRSRFATSTCSPGADRSDDCPKLNLIISSINVSCAGRSVNAGRVSNASACTCSYRTANPLYARATFESIRVLSRMVKTSNAILRSGNRSKNRLIGTVDSSTVSDVPV